MNNKTHTTIIWSLLIGTTALFVGLAIGLSIRAPSEAISLANPTHAAQDQGSFSTEPNAVANPTATDAQSNDTRDTGGEAFFSQTNADPDDDMNTIDDSATLARREELQYLQEVLPDNLMIPTEKSAQQVEQLLAEFEEHRQLQQRITSGEADAAERERYYQLRMQEYDEEIALIDQCKDVAANSLSSEEERNAQLCTYVAASSEERLQVIHESIVELEQQILFSDLSGH